MPFVNHDSDKTKYRDSIFPENFREKTDLGWHLAKNPT
jgi:hypothetical protein